MKILIDMNLSPAWAAVLKAEGHDSLHWIEIGAPTEKDGLILNWARDNGYVVFTHDLDFGAILAATKVNSPSVVQLRAQDPSPERCKDLIIPILAKYADQLAAGALISVDERQARLTLLPLRR